jgi:hypothetical protein
MCNAIIVAGGKKMIIAELHGKLSSRIKQSEDILTSNVFSFFKYASRQVYLRKLLSLIKIDMTDNDLENAEFIFWPNYDDGTEPDLVIIVGDYYILFEAKYFAGFGEEDGDRQAQLLRELRGGIREAENYRKDFVLVAITADYTYPKQNFTELLEQHEELFKFEWTNWQNVSAILLNILEEHQEQAPDYLLASDLYKLLDKKNLRGFLPFDRLTGIYPHDSVDEVFFPAETAQFSGQFTGFEKRLSGLSVEAMPQSLFFS